MKKSVSTTSDASAATASAASVTARVAASVAAIPRIVTEARVPTAGMVIANECDGSQQQLSSCTYSAVVEVVASMEITSKEAVYREEVSAAMAIP